MNDSTILGLGAAVLAVVMTFVMPVGARRVNQTLITVIIVVLCFVAAFSLFESPLSWGVAIGASLTAIIYRDVMRWLKHVYYDVTKYSRRDYWYRRIGETIVNRGRRRSRRR